jgi:DNA-binding NtrC family response regulator
MRTIVVADRNPNVRKLIQREPVADGYKVKTTGIGKELMELVLLDRDIDIVIIDPEIENNTRPSLLEQIKAVIPDVSIIIHSTEPTTFEATQKRIYVEWVPKNWESINELKNLIETIVFRNRLQANVDLNQKNEKKGRPL